MNHAKTFLFSLGYLSFKMYDNTMFLMKTQDSTLMQMHEMQLDHDPYIAPFGKIVLIAPFGKMILIVPFDKMIFNRSIWQNDF